MKNLIGKLLILNILIFSTVNFVYANSIEEAAYNIKQAKTASISEQKINYLDKARNILLNEYENNKTDINILMKLSETYQLLNLRKEAKLYIVQAYNIAPTDMYVQKAMGDYFFTFQEYNMAVEYYKLSLITGLLEDYETNLKVAQCFEKLGDLENAELYYKVCNFINPKGQEARNKINEYSSAKRPNNKQKLENAKYKYLFKDKPLSEEEQTEKESEDLIEKINTML